MLLQVGFIIINLDSISYIELGRGDAHDCSIHFICGRAVTLNEEDTKAFFRFVREGNSGANRICHVV